MTGRAKIIVSGIFLGLLTLSFRGADRPTATLAKYQQHAALRGQWITGYYSAGNGIEPVASIPWNKYTHVNHFAAAPGVSGGGRGRTIGVVQPRPRGSIPNRAPRPQTRNKSR